MSRDKQIEEMANIITDAMINGAENFVDCVVVAVEELVAKGYRKSTEVAEEIFAEIDKARKKWDTVHNIDHFGYNGSAFGYLEADVDFTIYELKKKYESEKDDGK